MASMSDVSSNVSGPKVKFVCKTYVRQPIR